MNSRMETACRGWLSALPLVLAGPAAIWLIVPLLDSGGSMTRIHENYAQGMRFIPSLIFSHLLGFLIFGLPLFIRFWHQTGGFWRLGIILPCGLLLGVLSGIPVSAFLGKTLLPGLTFLVFPAYGLLTALASWHIHRRDVRYRPLQ